MRYFLLFLVGFLCSGIIHHFDLLHMNSSSLELTGRTIADVHMDREKYIKSEGYAISPVKMKLPRVSFQWSNVWYYLKGEPYIPSVETRLSLEPNDNRDYLQLQRDAADWIVQNGAKDWVNDYRSIFLKEIAIDVLLSAHEHHLFPSVIFSQSILESGWGRSRLAVQYNNLFGIKGYSTDLKVRTTTYEKINGRRVAHKTSFRVFSSWGEAIQYHGDLLSTDARYQHAVQAKTYEEYIRLIAPQYASEPDYADLVVQLVEGYDLDRWDQFFIPLDGEPTYQIVRDDLFGVNYQSQQQFNFIQSSY